MNHIKHYEDNKETFDMWIREKTRLQVSNDIFKPLIEPFTTEFPTVNLNGCQDCIIDMLIWVKSEWKKIQNSTQKPKQK